MTEARSTALHQIVREWLASPEAEWRLATALPNVMSQETAESLYGAGTDPLDIHDEWFETPRNLAKAILAALLKGDAA